MYAIDRVITGMATSKPTISANTPIIAKKKESSNQRNIFEEFSLVAFQLDCNA